MTMIRSATRAVAILLTTVLALAAVPQGSFSPALAHEMPQVPLTQDIVTSFIKSYPAVKKRADALGKKYNVHGDKSSAANNWGAWLTASAAWAELNATVTPYGFSDFKSWLDATISIAMAYTFAKEGGAMDAGMAQAAEQIKNNASIPEAQKKLMLEQMQASAGSLAAVRPPKENIDAVTPFVDQLTTLFH